MKQKKESRELSEAEQMKVVQKLCDFLKEKYEVVCSNGNLGKTVLFWPKGKNRGYVYASLICKILTQNFPFGLLTLEADNWLYITSVTGLDSNFTLSDVNTGIRKIDNFVKKQENDLYVSDIKRVIERFDDAA